MRTDLFIERLTAALKTHGAISECTLKTYGDAVVVAEAVGRNGSRKTIKMSRKPKKDRPEKIAKQIARMVAA
jgi:hypothetical protein